MSNFPPAFKHTKYAQYLFEILFSFVSSGNDTSANTLHLQTHFLLSLQKMLKPIGPIYLIIIISNRKMMISKHSALVSRKNPLLTIWWRTAVNLFLPMERDNPMPMAPSLALYQHATRPELSWKPLLSKGFGSPIVKEKYFPQTYHGSFIFSWQFHCPIISNEWKDQYWTIFCQKNVKNVSKTIQTG